jgi:hypothetical protein
MQIVHTTSLHSKKENNQKGLRNQQKGRRSLKNVIESVSLRHQMIDYRMDDSFKCRLCQSCFPNPKDLRLHSMVKHKGHMLPIKR